MTKDQLKEKWWYRLVQVLSIALFLVLILVTQLTIHNVAFPTEYNLDLSHIVCKNGSKYSLKEVGVNPNRQFTSSEDTNRIRLYCFIKTNGGYEGVGKLIKNSTDAYDDYDDRSIGIAYADKYALRLDEDGTQYEFEPYRIDPVYVGWSRLYLYMGYTLIVTIFLIWLVRRIFFYIVIRESFFKI